MRRLYLAVTVSLLLSCVAAVPLYPIVQGAVGRNIANEQAVLNQIWDWIEIKLQALTNANTRAAWPYASKFNMAETGTALGVAATTMLGNLRTQQVTVRLYDSFPTADCDSDTWAFMYFLGAVPQTDLYICPKTWAAKMSNNIQDKDKSLYTVIFHELVHILLAADDPIIKADGTRTPDEPRTWAKIQSYASGTHKQQIWTSTYVWEHLISFSQSTVILESSVSQFKIVADGTTGLKIGIAGNAGETLRVKVPSSMDKQRIYFTNAAGKVLYKDGTTTLKFGSATNEDSAVKFDYERLGGEDLLFRSGGTQFLCLVSSKLALSSTFNEADCLFRGTWDGIQPRRDAFALEGAATGLAKKVNPGQYDVIFGKDTKAAVRRAGQGFLINADGTYSATPVFFKVTMSTPHLQALYLTFTTPTGTPKKLQLDGGVGVDRFYLSTENTRYSNFEFKRFPASMRP